MNPNVPANDRLSGPVRAPHMCDQRDDHAGASELVMRPHGGRAAGVPAQQNTSWMLLPNTGDCYARITPICGEAGLTTAPGRGRSAAAGGPPGGMGSGWQILGWDTDSTYSSPARRSARSPPSTGANFIRLSP